MPLMSTDWAENTAQKLLGRILIKKGICLILGASDTGKTTLAWALTKKLVSNQPVGIVDADVGQSHIGPPTTVGWAIVDNPQADFSKLTASSISFVGDITPVGRLLQFTAAINQCVQQVSKAVELIIIDTPGLVFGSAASALWWTVQQILKPKLILGVQRNDEINHIITGLRSFDSAIELINSPPQIRTKSPEQRRSYRQSQFDRYFLKSKTYNISLKDVSIQSGRRLSREGLINKLVGLRDAKGTDLAIGIIHDWQDDKWIAEIKAPQLDIQQIRCLVIGDISIDTTDK